jgi:exopolyphosphatase/guanosine-5'-triphosphate,3'-diphosphate pyrophosphatase
LKKHPQVISLPAAQCLILRPCFFFHLTSITPKYPITLCEREVKMARYAVIDCGTNSVKCLIADDTPAYTQLADEMLVTRLGEGLQHTGSISPAAMQRTVSAIEHFRQQAIALDACSITLTGTMALRSAHNAAAVIREIIATTGLVPQILTGETEARLSYLAAAQLLPSNTETGLIFDTGGGSTECIVGTRQEMQQRVSINLGAVQPTERYLKHDPPTDAEYSQMQRSIATALQNQAPQAVPQCIVGIGGTVTTLAAMQLQMEQYNGTAIHGYQLSKSAIDRTIATLRSLGHAQRIQLPGLHPQRADIILAGATMVQQILQHYSQTSLLVSNRGLRHALWQAMAHNQSLEEV